MRILLALIMTGLSASALYGQDFEMTAPETMPEGIPAPAPDTIVVPPNLSVEVNLENVYFDSPRSRIRFRPVDADDMKKLPLVLSNVPSTAWLEIEGAWYRHSDPTGLARVGVHIPFDTSRSHLGPPTIVLRAGRSPRDIRLQQKNSRTAEITLIAGQTVEFDLAREFGDRPFSNASSNSNYARSEPAVAVSSPAPIPNGGGAPTVATPVTPPQDLKFTYYNNGDRRDFAVTVDRVDPAAVVAVTIADSNSGESPQLTLAGNHEFVSQIVTECTLVGSVSANYITAAGNPDTAKFDDVRCKLEFGEVTRNGDEIHVVLMLKAARFQETLEKESKIKTFLRKAAPQQDDIVFEFSDSKIEFTNGVYKEGDKGIVVYDLDPASPQPQIRFQLTAK